jgi:hypothetical protein
MKNKYTKKCKRKFNGGKNEKVFEDFSLAIHKLRNSLNQLLKTIDNKEKNNIDVASVENEIPKDLMNKIQEEQHDMENILKDIDKKEEDINKKENLDASKQELEKDIINLREKINEGVKENFLIKNKERNRSFYLQGRTWNEWFYGFVEYYNELKDSLRDIIENNYYKMILRKPLNERTQNEIEIIKKVNDLEVELTKLNNNNDNNKLKGGYRKPRYTRKRKNNKI